MADQCHISQWVGRSLRCHPSVTSWTVYPQVVVVNSLHHKMPCMGQNQWAPTCPPCPHLHRKISRKGVSCSMEGKSGPQPNMICIVRSIVTTHLWSPGCTVATPRTKSARKSSIGRDVKSLMRRWRNMAALSLPVAILDDLISASCAPEVVQYVQEAELRTSKMTTGSGRAAILCHCHNRDSRTHPWSWMTSFHRRHLGWCHPRWRWQKWRL